MMPLVRISDKELQEGVALLEGAECLLSRIRQQDLRVERLSLISVSADTFFMLCI